MSQYIFDEVYGSEAKKKKISQSSNYLYYRQIMKIKSKHIRNPSLYSQIYQLPNQSTTIQSPQSKSKSSYSPEFLSTLNKSNYAIQKLNSHAFKIIKRKQKVPLISQTNNCNFNKTLNNNNNKNKFPFQTNRKLVSRTIDRDANDIRSYLNQQQKNNSNISRNKIKNLSLDLSSKSKLRTISTFRKTERQGSPFSTFRNSGISFKKF